MRCRENNHKLTCIAQTQLNHPKMTQKPPKNPTPKRPMTQQSARIKSTNSSRSSKLADFNAYHTLINENGIDRAQLIVQIMKNQPGGQFKARPAIYANVDENRTDKPLHHY